MAWTAPSGRGPQSSSRPLAASTAASRLRSALAPASSAARNRPPTKTTPPPYATAMTLSSNVALGRGRDDTSSAAAGVAATAVISSAPKPSQHRRRVPSRMVPLPRSSLPSVCLMTNVRLGLRLGAVRCATLFGVLTIGVLGLGLIGGSLLRALAAAGHTTRGYDASAETRTTAAAEGWQIADSVAEAATGTDLVFL